MKRISLMLLAFAFASCTHQGAQPGAEHHAAKGGHTAAHWGYTGETGPAHWGDMKADYHTCKDGMKQSPIDITGETDGTEPNLVFNYQSSAINIVNNGHTIQVNIDAGSSITVDGTPYDLLQFHFHKPSENKDHGAYHAMEVHMVHKSAAGGLAVVGVFLDEVQSNALLDAVFTTAPAKPGKATAEGMIHPGDLLPANKAIYAWSGSLTTPPCSEGVQWLMMQQPMTVSAEQSATFTKIIGQNNRPVQPLNERAIVK